MVEPKSDEMLAAALTLVRRLLLLNFAELNCPAVLLPK